MSQLDPLFQPLTINGLVIKNRFLSTSHAPGYTLQGNITERYIHYEAEKAKGGVGLLQFGGATSVAVEGYRLKQLDQHFSSLKLTELTSQEVARKFYK